MIAPNWALAAALAVAPFAVVLQNRVMAPIALAGMAGCVVLGWLRGWRPSALPRLAWPAVALLAWMALSALWAPEAGRALDGAARLGISLALALLAADALRREPPSALIPRAAAIGVAIGIAAAAFDHLSGNLLRGTVRGLPAWDVTLSFGLKNAGAVLALLLPLAVFAPSLPLWPRVALGLIGGALVLMLPGDSAKLAVLAGLGAGLAGQFVLRATRAALAATAMVLVLALPWALGAFLPLDAGRLPPSAAHRLLIWDFVSDRVAERPLLGWGMEASRAVPGGTGHPDAAMLADFGLTAQSAWFASAQLLPLHPHNLALQSWLELGAVGAALMAMLLAMLALSATGGAACGAYAAGLVIAMLSYGAWQYWWVAAVLLAAVTVTRLRSVSASSS
ncbi:O-antigen ligase family protein [Roseococcus sp.]|uniref:O-antigen ligase family protein n=1 Tax=Roseococcus sp. TaxID=2109646 RepID=UPI003BAA8549